MRLCGGDVIEGMSDDMRLGIGGKDALVITGDKEAIVVGEGL